MDVLILFLEVLLRWLFVSQQGGSHRGPLVGTMPEALQTEGPVDGH